MIFRVCKTKMKYYIILGIAYATPIIAVPMQPTFEYHNNNPNLLHTIIGDTPSKTRKQRTIFSQDQKRSLEEEFNNNHFITIQQRKKLSSRLNLTEFVIKVWFQNRRNKHKKNNTGGLRNSRRSSPCLHPQPTPLQYVPHYIPCTAQGELTQESPPLNSAHLGTNKVTDLKQNMT